MSLTTSTALPQQRRQTMKYVADQINAMSPVEILIKLYDVAIASCAQKDQRRLSRALVELIASLNFDYQEVAIGLFRLYNYCLRNARMGRFDVVQPILVELRDTWRKALDQQRAQAGAASSSTASEA